MKEKHISNNLFTLVLSHELDEGKTGGILYFIPNSELNKKKFEDLNLNNIRVREISGNTEQRLEKFLMDEERKLFTIFEKKYAANH